MAAMKNNCKRKEAKIGCNIKQYPAEGNFHSIPESIPGDNGGHSSRCCASRGKEIGIVILSFHHSLIKRCPLVKKKKKGKGRGSGGL